MRRNLSGMKTKKIETVFRLKESATRIGWTSLAVLLCCLGMPYLAQAQSVRADFNNDGFDDLAIGVPNEQVGNKAAAGAVNLIYGRTNGLSSTGNQLWSQDGIAVEGSPDTNDHFGAAVAAGDFDGDGFADLAIGVPGEDAGLDTDCGGVNVIYGGVNGLDAGGLGDQLWTQGSFGMKGFRQDFDAFGSALASGDFNGDGFDDLAIGVPLEDSRVYDLLVNTAAGNSGCVNVIFGSSSGLDVSTVIGDQKNDQVIQNPIGLLVFNQNLGASLTTGDFDRDGFADLAVGVPGDLVVAGGANFSSAGSVQVYFGSTGGFLPAIRPVFGFKVNGGNVSNLRFGSTVAAGDFNGDLFSDLAVGSPFSTVGSVQAGVVRVYPGGLSQLSQTFGLFHQDVANVVGVAQANDEFGATLAPADFNGDGFIDLAVGVPGEDINGFNNAGAVNVLRGSASGLTGVGSQEWHQDTAVTFGTISLAVDDVAEANDQFGRTITAGDFDGNGADDLAVGVPLENSGAGVVHVIEGGIGTIGLALLNGDTFWTQNTANILGTSASGDQFGGALIGAPRNGPGGPGFSGVWGTIQVSVKNQGSKQSSRIDGDLIVFNPGGELAARSEIDIYLSADGQLDANDLLVETVRRFAELQPGESRVAQVKVKVNNVDARGMKLIAILDATNVVPEANEDNNVIVSGPLTSAADQFFQSLWQQFLAWLQSLGFGFFAAS